MKDDSNLTSLEDDPQTLQILEVKKTCIKRNAAQLFPSAHITCQPSPCFSPCFSISFKGKNAGGFWDLPLLKNGAPELGLVVEPTPKTRKIGAVVKLDHPPREDEGVKRKNLIKPPQTYQVIRDS